MVYGILCVHDILKWLLDFFKSHGESFCKISKLGICVRRCSLKVKYTF